MAAAVFCAPQPSLAQKQASLLRRFWHKKIHKNIHPRSIDAARVNAAVQRALWLSKQKHIFPASASQAVFLIHSPFYEKNPFMASGFIIEENYQGERFLWGVTAKHITDLLEPSFNAVFMGKEKPFSVPAEVVFTGSQFGIDLALLKLKFPPNTDIQALPLGQNPLPGEKMHSFGYAQGLGTYTQNQSVFFTGANRIFFSFEFAAHFPRAGLCGSPLLNSQEEVTGIHCASRADHSTCLAVPVQHLKMLLAAYRGNQRAATRELILNGKKLGEIQVNQAIFGMYVYQGGQLRTKKEISTPDFISLYPTPPRQETLANPAQLEKFIPCTPAFLHTADYIEFSVFTEPPGLFYLQDIPVQQTLYRYYPSTGEVSLSHFTGPLGQRP